MPRKICLLWLCLSLSVWARAQHLTLAGSVADSASREPLIGTVVILHNQADTAEKQYASTDAAGKFAFARLKRITYVLRVRYLGYADFARTVNVNQPNQTLEPLYLSPQAKLLQQVEVRGKTPLAVQKGDTTEMNAKAFKVNRDASAEDLVNKMPGVSSVGGTVQAQGETVGKVLVDGKEFFGNDATIALKNLPAEVIDKIQVFDQLSDQSQFSGFDDGNTTKTINIVTKADRRNSRFGKVYAGYGTDQHYQAGGNLNFFSGKRRISIIGLSNNINLQNFSSQDLLGITNNGNNNNGGRGNQGGANNFLVGQQNGINTSNSLGLNYSDNWGKKITVTGSYFLNVTRNTTTQALERTYFLPNSTNQFYRQNSVSTSPNQNHRFNLRLEYKIDSLNSIIFTPSLNLQGNRSQNNSLATTFLSPEALLNQSANNTGSRAWGYSMANSLLYRHRFAKRGRTISWNISTQLSNQYGRNQLAALNQYFQERGGQGNGGQSDSLNQQTNTHSNGYTYASNLAYTEPVGKKGQIQVNYNLSYTQGLADRRTYKDYADPVYSVLDTALSNTTNNQYVTQQAGLSYRYNQQQKLRLAIGAAFQNARLSNDRVFPISSGLERNFNNILPNFNLRYNFSKNSNLRVQYRTSTDAPSVSQLQSVVNNSNPLLLSTGNPSLKQEFTQNFVLRYSLNNTGRATTFFALLNVSQTQNNISNATVIARRDTSLGNGIVLNKGAQLSMPVNLSGYWNGRAFLNYGFPLTKLKTNLNLNSGLTYTQTPSLVNGNRNLSASYLFTQGVVFSSNISEKVDFTLSYNANYNAVTNSIQPTLNNRYFYQVTSFKNNLVLPLGFVLQNDLTHTWYTGLASGFNQKFLLWNVSVGKKMLKKDSGELKLTVFDLLNQNNSISRTVTETYLQDLRTQVLRQYFLLTFTYTLRAFQ